jgi:hypothetical protein
MRLLMSLRCDHENCWVMALVQVRIVYDDNRPTLDPETPDGWTYARGLSGYGEGQYPDEYFCPLHGKEKR